MKQTKQELSAKHLDITAAVTRLSPSTLGSFRPRGCGLMPQNNIPKMPFYASCQPRALVVPKSNFLFKWKVLWNTSIHLFYSTHVELHNNISLTLSSSERYIQLYTFLWIIALWIRNPLLCLERQIGVNTSKIQVHHRYLKTMKTEKNKKAKAFLPLSTTEKSRHYAFRKSPGGLAYYCGGSSERYILNKHKKFQPCILHDFL